MLCMITDCPAPVKAKGLCNKHYLRQWNHGDPNTLLTTFGLSLEERLAYNSQVNPETGCILWQGAIESNGYARMEIAPEGKKIPVHRLAYELYRGEIPKGLVIDHLCRNRRCVNPDHLEPVTHKENILRGVGPSAVNAKRTHCTYGHLLEGDNLIMVKHTRRCRECTRRRGRERWQNGGKERQREYRAKQKEKET